MKFRQAESPLIEAPELLKLRGQAGVVILDVSPATNKSGLQALHPGKKIAGALIVDLKTDFSDTDSPWPNMVPPPEAFADKLIELGIDEQTRVIVYDKLGIYTAPRLWWLFRIMGHQRVRVLNGGLDAWLASGGAVEGRNGWGDATPLPDRESANRQSEGEKTLARPLQTAAVWSREDVLRNLENPTATLVDARSAGRFTATAPEPRAGWPSGHIPASVSTPFKTLLTEGSYRPAEVLQKILAEQVGESDPLVFSCGSGLTACIDLLAAALVWPERELYLYDGSWTEWAAPSQKARLIATGPRKFVGCKAPTERGQQPPRRVWRELGPQQDKIKEPTDDHSYSIHEWPSAPDAQEKYNYWAARAVRDYAGQPAGLARLELPAQTYVVYRHRGPASTFMNSWQKWLKSTVPAGFKLTDGTHYERLPPTYDPLAEAAEEDAWLPVENGNNR